MIYTPTSLKKIKLKNYQKLVIKENPTNEDLIKCILDITSDELSKTKATDIDQLVYSINDLFSKEQSFIPTFTLYGTTYGFIPNLDKISYGENKDITSYINDWGNMHKAMAVMYRPITQMIGDKYTIEPYEGSHVYSEVMKDSPVNVAMGAMVFFFNLTSALLTSIPNFLQKEIKKEQIKGVVSPESGEVIQSCIPLLKETLQDLKKLQNYRFTNA